MSIQWNQGRNIRCFEGVWAPLSTKEHPLTTKRTSQNNYTGGRSRAAKVGPRPCRHHEVLSGWGFRQPNPPAPKIYFLLGFGHLILKILKITMLIGVHFAWIVQFSFCSFVDSVCSALLMCLSALQCRYYLRSGAGNIIGNIIGWPWQSWFSGCD